MSPASLLLYLWINVSLCALNQIFHFFFNLYARLSGTWDVCLHISIKSLVGAFSAMPHWFSFPFFVETLLRLWFINSLIFWLNYVIKNVSLQITIGMENVNWAAQMNTDSLFVMKCSPSLHWTCSLLILQFNLKSNYIKFDNNFFTDPKKQVVTYFLFFLRVYQFPNCHTSVSHSAAQPCTAFLTFVALSMLSEIPCLNISPI